ACCRERAWSVDELRARNTAFAVSAEAESRLTVTREAGPRRRAAADMPAGRTRNNNRARLRVERGRRRVRCALHDLRRGRRIDAIESIQPDDTTIRVAASGDISDDGSAGPARHGCDTHAETRAVERVRNDRGRYTADRARRKAATPRPHDASDDVARCESGPEIHSRECVGRRRAESARRDREERMRDLSAAGRKRNDEAHCRALMMKSMPAAPHP